MTAAVLTMTPDLAKGDGVTDDVTALQTFLTAALAAGAAAVIPAPKSYRLASTGLHYASNAMIVLRGDLINAHVGPLVGTQHALAGPKTGRASNVMISGQGGVIRAGAPDTTGSTRKGLGITNTDGFDIRGIQTSGALTGFNVEINNSTQGVIEGLRLQGANNIAGDDGLHFYGQCQHIVGGDLVISSGDDSLSFTAEDSSSENAQQNNITLSGLDLQSLRFSCIKAYCSAATGKAVIRKIRLSDITGAITAGPTGGPIILDNGNGYAAGAVIEDFEITGADLDWGAATETGAHTYLRRVQGIKITDAILRGRMGPFYRADYCSGLKMYGDVWETVPGQDMTALVLLIQCADYDINLVVRDATGKRIGTVVASNTKADAGTVTVGMTPA